MKLGFEYLVNIFWCLTRKWVRGNSPKWSLKMYLANLFLMVPVGAPFWLIAIICVSVFEAAYLIEAITAVIMGSWLFIGLGFWIINSLDYEYNYWDENLASQPPENEGWLSVVETPEPMFERVKYWAATNNHYAANYAKGTIVEKIPVLTNTSDFSHWKHIDNK